MTGGPGSDYFRTGTGDDHFDGSEDMDTLDFSVSERGSKPIWSPEQPRPSAIKGATRPRRHREPDRNRRDR